MEQLRGYSKGYYFSAVASMILGAALLVWPETSMQTFCYTPGSCQCNLRPGKDCYVSHQRPDGVPDGAGSGGWNQCAGIRRICSAEIAVCSLSASVLYRCISADWRCGKASGALDLKRLGFGAWWLILLIALAMFVLGGVLVANPFEAARVVVILIGTGLLADGLANLFNLLMITHLFKKAKQKKAEQEAVIVEAHEVVSREDRKAPAKK